MKQNYKYLCAALAIPVMAITGMSCKKQLDKLTPNPDGFTTTRIEYILPTTINTALTQQYADAYNNYIGKLCPMMQVLAINTDPVSGNWYIVNNDLGVWGRYYTSQMNNLKGIQQIYNTQLNEQEKQGYKVYLSIAKILEAYSTAQATDVYNDIPYSEAFKGINGLFNQPGSYYAKYDNQASIYNALLTDLKQSAADLATVTFQPTVYDAHRALPAQDILFQGVLSKWVKLANSLRLRYAMRLSDVDPARAKAEIADLLTGNAPMVLTNADNAILGSGPIGNATGGTGNTILRALFERSPNIFAPKFMVDNMKQAGDPRLMVMFKPQSKASLIPASAYNGYAGAYAQRTGVDAATIAKLDTVSFVNNTNLPAGVGITAADVNFNLAEAYYKGLTPSGASNAQAQAYYETGIKQSVEFYYSIYIASPVANKRPALTVQPTPTAINLMLTTAPYAFNSSSFMQQLAYQKWLNTGFMEMYETYAEFRRLDFQTVLPPDIYQGQTVSRIPVRFLYPISEASSNAENFNAVSAQNNDKTRVYWDFK